MKTFPFGFMQCGCDMSDVNFLFFLLWDLSNLRIMSFINSGCFQSLCLKISHLFLHHSFSSCNPNQRHVFSLCPLGLSPFLLHLPCFLPLRTVISSNMADCFFDWIRLGQHWPCGWRALGVQGGEEVPVKGRAVVNVSPPSWSLQTFCSIPDTWTARDCCQSPC